MQIVEITISGGAVQDVQLPRGIKVIIRDYDIEGDDLDGPNICTDEDGPYQRMEFVHEEDKPRKTKRPTKPHHS